MSIATVQLTRIELMIAAQVGAARRLTSARDGITNNRHANNQGDWQVDIDGACGEMALAKYLGVYWSPGVRTFKLPDVGLIQVRATTLPHGCLIIRPNDQNDDECFALVTCAAPDFMIAGWLRCGEAKADRFWKGDAWFVPQAHLHKKGIDAPCTSPSIKVLA